MVSEQVLTVNLRLEELETGVFSPRKAFGAKYIDQLAESIESEGQLKPIIVRPHPALENRYQVIDGEHRIRAFKKLGLTTIRAEVRTLNDEEAHLLAMRVNQMHGKRLNELEEGLHIKKMMDRFGYTQRQMAERFKKSQAWVNYRLRLVEKLASETREAFKTRVIKTAHARELSELPKNVQPTALARVIKDKLSFKKTETLVHAIKDHPENMAEILAKPIEEVAPLPQDIKEFIEKHGPEQPLIEFWECPVCKTPYTISWVWCQIRRRPEG